MRTPHRECSHHLTQLLKALSATPELAIAVSGGVDSTVLAFIAHRFLRHATMYHAASAAVPQAATERLQAIARAEGWRLTTVDAGELSTPNYVSNPVNRCYYCKSQLYRTIRRQTDAPIASGNNLSDLADYRPGLVAAAEQDVMHPYIEAGIDKDQIRELAHEFGLDEVGELPASPCLASRIETGIPVTRAALTMIDRVETLVRDRLDCRTVRCRVRAGGVCIEIDASALPSVSRQLHDEVTEAVHGTVAHAQAVSFSEYRRGSSFLR